MSHFTARVQLPGNPSSEHYARLHYLMQELGLYLVTDNLNGGNYVLPHGFYAGHLILELSALGRVIKTRADSVVLGAQVAVTEGNMYFEGLDFIPQKKAWSR